MTRAIRRTLLGAGGFIALLLLAALVASRLLNAGPYKAQLETAASQALGMEVRIGGPLSIRLFPSPHLALEDGRILGEREAVVASVKRLGLWVNLFALLRGELKLERIDLGRPVLSMERDAQGRSNVEPLKHAIALLGALDGARVTISDGMVRDVDRRGGNVLEATGLDVDVSRLRFGSDTGAPAWASLSLQATLACREIRAGALSLSHVKASVDGHDGALQMRPVSMQLFGGTLTGSVEGVLSGAEPRYQIRCTLPGFRIEEFLKVLSPERAAEGPMDFSANLSVQGVSPNEWVRSANGTVSLRGRGITLLGSDLDAALSRFRSSQSFNLVDVGAVFFAGPMGLAVTRGYGFASLFRGSGGSSAIGTLVSDWRIERGVAHATDVAMATAKNRIALWGGLDFVKQQYSDVTVAVVNAKGCATVRQVIRGSFRDPVVEKPRFLEALAGPVIRLVRQTRNLFPSGPCELSYAGSVPAPQ